MQALELWLDPEGADVEKACAFCEANGLDATKIPSQGGLRIVDDTIHYRVFLERTSDHRGPWRTAPLASPPDEHGIATRTVEVD